MSFNQNDSQNLAKSSRSPKKSEKGSDSFTTTASVVKAKIVKALNVSKTLNLKPFNPSMNRLYTMRAPIVTEDWNDEPVNFDGVEHQRLITDILNIKPHRRFDEEISFLRRAFKDLDFFKQTQIEMEEAYFNKLFQVMRVETFKAGQKVFSYGDIGKNFYIVIKGSAYIMLKSAGVVLTEEQSRPHIPQDEEILRIRGNLGAILQSDITESEKKETVEICYPGYWIVSEKHRGESFGEIALTKNGNRLRTATVICASDTIFGVLSYNDYQNILGALHEKKFAENVECLSQIDMFKHWKENQITSFLMSVDEAKFTRNQQIFKAGDMPTQIFFIKKGEVELRKVVDIIDKDREREEYVDERQAALMSRPISSKPKQWRKQEAVRLAILTKGDYFGEGELISLKPREYTAVAYSSEVVVMTINRERFISFVKDKKSLQTLDAHIKGKKEWHTNLITKLVTLRTVPTETNLDLLSPVMSPKDIILAKSTAFLGDELTDSPRIVKTASSPSRKNLDASPSRRNLDASPSRRNLEIKPVSILLDDKSIMQSPLLNSARSIKAIPVTAVPVTVVPSPKLKEPGSPFKSPSNSRGPLKERPPKLMSPGFSFTLFKKGYEGNPIYEKQIEKLARKLKQDRQQESQEAEQKARPLKVKVTPIAITAPSSPMKDKYALTPRKVGNIEEVMKLNYGKWNDYGEGISPIKITSSTPRRENRRSQDITVSDNPMYRMCKNLGLDRVYSDKDMTLVGLNGNTCTPIKSMLNTPRVISVSSKPSTARDVHRRKYSSQALKTVPDIQPYSLTARGPEENDVFSPKFIYFNGRKESNMH